MESGFPVTGDQSGDTIKTFADFLISWFLREISLSMQRVIDFFVKLEIMDAVKDLEDLRMSCGNWLEALAGDKPGQ
jgi:plasmid maintenance system killer protein